MIQQNVFGVAAQFREYLENAYFQLTLDMPHYYAIPFQEAAKKVFQRAERYLMEDEGVGSFIEDMRYKIGFAAASPEVCIEYAARQTCREKSLPKDSPEILSAFYRSVVLPCMLFRSKLLEHFSLNHPQLSDTERVILRLGFYIAQEFNRMFEKWWKQVVIPYRKRLPLTEDAKELIRKAGKTNMYSVLVRSGGIPILSALTPELIKGAKEIPLTEAFPEEVRKIQSYLLYLVDNLPTEEKEYRNYFRALYRALGNRDLAKMERCWLAVDKAWVKISSDKLVVPVHMMEHGYHDPFRVSPEYRIMLRLPDFGDVIAAMRQNMRDLAGQIGDETDTAKIDTIDIGAFLTIVNGGCGIDFRYAGQSVPNRPDAQKLGMKIFLDGASMDVRLEHHKRLLELCLDEETWAWVEPAFNLENMYALVAGHEFAHPLLINDKLVKAFGEDKPKVEEGKATLLGIAGVKKGIDNGQWGPEAHLGLSASILAESVRLMEKNLFNNPTFAPYVNESMMILSVLRRAGLLSIVDGKLHMSKETAASGRVPIELFNEVTIHLITSYINKDLSAALQLIQIYADRESEDVKSVFNIVNSNLEHGSKK